MVTQRTLRQRGRRLRHLSQAARSWQARGVARYYEVHPVDPQPRTIRKVVDLLREDGLIAYPTDSCYALGGLLAKAPMERIKQIRGLDDKHHYTLMCKDFSQLGQFVEVDNRVFRAIKANTPGGYTFILPATREVPRRFMHPKKWTVGARIPRHPVAQALLDELGEPLLSSTLLLPGLEDPLTDGWEIKERLDGEVDAVIDSGECGTTPTTVVDFSQGYPEVVRRGAGDPDPFE